MNNIPDIVDIELTNKCDLDCVFCFGPEYSKSDNDMPLNFWLNVLDFLSRSNCKCVIISGGEPTLYPNLKDVVKYAKETGLSVLLSTNGLDKQTIIQCSHYCDTIALPLDACEKELVFNIRGIYWGIEDLIDLTREIKKVNNFVKIRVGSVATSLNCESLIRLAEQIKLSASDIDIWKIYQYAVRRKKLKNAKLLSVSDEKFTMLQEKIGYICSDVSFNIEFLSNAKRQKAYLFIYYDGTVIVPNQRNEEDLIIGNINVEGFNVFEKIRNIDYKKNRNNNVNIMTGNASS
jgi:MoaA/NifB/PqqE/SkfB family radical SAM enzyme